MCNLQNQQAVVTVVNLQNRQQVSSLFTSVASAIAWAELAWEARPCDQFQVVVHQISAVAWCSAQNQIKMNG